EVSGIGPLQLPPEGIDVGQPGATVGIAVRPEKVRLHPQRPAQTGVALKGRVSQIAYYGETSHVFLTLDGGHTINANVQNEQRTVSPLVAVGDELWCSWDTRDVLLLTN
ncbi:MAG: TOBE domain-containing protein, partial [Kiloniellales bacterium]